MAGSRTDLPSPLEVKLELLKEELIGQYRCMLHITDSEVWAVCRRQVEQVISDCVASLRQQRVILSERNRVLTEELAARSVHWRLKPSKLLQSGLGLFDLVVEALADVVGAHPEAARSLGFGLLTLSQSMSIRVQLVSDLYDTVLLGRTRDIQAGDRRRLAREIHDLIGNSVGLAIRHLDLYEIHREGGQPAADDKLEDCRRVLGDVLDVCRRLISDLRLQPPVASLSQALNDFVQSVEQDTVVDVSVLGDEAALPSEYRDELFLVMRECLRNVFAHAHARKATALVQIEDGQVFAVVEDDGVGFDVDAVGLSGRDDGISTMKERTELLGGRLSASSHVSRGTRIEIRIPLPEPSHVQYV